MRPGESARLMMPMGITDPLRKLKTLFIGGARNLSEANVFHQLSLAAFLAWVGLGSDGMSSSAYGPPEAYTELLEYPHLSFFVALGTALTVIVISMSYMQIIRLFPGGGGGYVVASKLLSPSVGMVCGCALLIDYVLTISVSIASGVDAILSFLPPGLSDYKIAITLCGVLGMTLMNLRGVRESVAPLVPIFLVFVLTHAFAIVWAFASHVGDVSHFAAATGNDIAGATSALGFGGMLMLMLHAYSMGAGTYTGIEAVSNGMSMLREPRVHTARRTMIYMAISLSVIALGLMVAYVLYEVRLPPGSTKTVNAVLFESLAGGWGTPGYVLVLAALVSEAAILLVAAQTGFLGGPRVLANMALDRWLPSRFSLLSDRLVTQNGILLMGAAAMGTILVTGGSVRMLVILYSINVFITFCLSQLGMVRHWWQAREPKWKRSITINGIGLVLCAFILIMLVLVKFNEGGWKTLVITGALVVVALLTRRHYNKVHRILSRLDVLVTQANAELAQPAPADLPTEPDPRGKTAVLLVNGFNGLGLHSLLSIPRLFGDTFRNIVFVQIGMVDAGNFKGTDEIEHLRGRMQADLQKYVEFARRNGYYAESRCAVGVDVIETLWSLAPGIIEAHPRSVFFGGQLVFPEGWASPRFLHNYVVFSIQRRLYLEGIPFMILPVRI
jgi:amino acid transporter